MSDLLILAAEEGVVEAGTGGFWADTAGIMLVLPFVAFLLILAFGKHLKHKGGEIAVGALAINLVWATVLFVMNMTGGVLDQTTFEIARIGSDLVFELGWMVDGLSIMMYFLVNFVGLLVFIYALGYMEGDVRVPWFFAAFSLFAGAMLILVGAPNLIQMIIGWEGVGLASYFLIGFYWESLDNVKAGNKAFLTNKVADVGLILGAILLGVTLGDFDFAHLAEEVVNHPEVLGGVAMAGGLLLFFGAMGKSAQFPLHIWLPDAMAGPTPVSALIHAATMVVAGVYLVARLFPMYYFVEEGFVLNIVAYVGAFSSLFAAIIAITQTDIKRVLAFSTMSQIGYMMMALGVSGYDGHEGVGYMASMFHLFSHSMFKAL